MTERVTADPRAAVAGGPLAVVRNIVSRQELDREVEREARQIEVNAGGRQYLFKPQTKCRICTYDDSRRKVNEMLAKGFTYAEILRAVAPFNAKRAKGKHINRDCLKHHAKYHFDLTEGAMATYRRILEKRADEQEQDWVNGVGGIVNALSYLEIMGQKALENLIKEETKVPVELGMNALLKLHDLTHKGAHDQEVAQLRHKVNAMGTAIREVVPPEYWGQIVERIEEIAGQVGPKPVDVEVVDDYDDDDDDPFDPVVEPDLEDSLEP